MPTHTILMIDDDADFLELTKTRLEANGYEVSTAADGPDGVRQAKANTPDVILLDVVMPGMDGGDVSQALSSDAALRAVPVIHLTTLISASEADRRSRDGSEEVFVSKTSPVPKLLEAISRAIEKREHDE